MDQSPLVSGQIDAGARFITEFQRFAPVYGAFWLLEEGEREWFLYVVTDQGDDEAVFGGYDEVARIADEMRDPHMNPFRVKLVDRDDPMAVTVNDVQRRHPGSIAANLLGRMVGGVGIEGVHVYSMPAAVPA